jgi:hypothetical protein
MEYNTGFYMDGTPWAIPLKEVRLKKQWTKKSVTLYMAFEDNQTPYWIEVTELGDNKRSVLITGSILQTTTLSLTEFLRKFSSLKLSWHAKS